MKKNIDLKIKQKKIILIGLMIFFLFVPIIMFNIENNNRLCNQKSINENCRCNKQNKSCNKDSFSSSQEAFDAEDLNERLLNDPLIKSLVYPKCNHLLDYSSTFPKCDWLFQDTSVLKMDRKYKMWSAASISERTKNTVINVEEDLDEYISEKNMTDSFTKIFGPDAQYENGIINEKKFFCGFAKEYKDNRYYIPSRCGGDYPINLYNYTQPTKVEIIDDKINVYFVFVYYINLIDSENYLFSSYPVEKVDYNFENELINKTGIKASSIEKGFNQLLVENKLKTYKYTFKKQSDGNYYFFSGELQ